MKKAQEMLKELKQRASSTVNIRIKAMGSELKESLSDLNLELLLASFRTLGKLLGSYRNFFA